MTSCLRFTTPGPGTLTPTGEEEIELMKSPSAEAQERLRSKIRPPTAQILRNHTNSQSLTLEVGCGPGQYRLAVNGGYVGVDITADNYNEETPRTPDVVADGMYLPFKRGTFDVIFFSNTFYYFEDHRFLLSQVMEVLKTGGSLVVFDYSKTTLKRLGRVSKKSDAAVYIHIRKSYDWIKHFNENGFCEVELLLNSLSLRAKMANKFLPRSIKFPLIDRLEASVVVTAKKL